MEYCEVKYFTKEDAEHMHAEQAAQAHHRQVEDFVVSFVLIEFVVTHLDSKVYAKNQADYHVGNQNQNT